jgi:hypothetical protein
MITRHCICLCQAVTWQRWVFHQIPEMLNFVWLLRYHDDAVKDQAQPVFPVMCFAAFPA